MFAKYLVTELIVLDAFQPVYKTGALPFGYQIPLRESVGSRTRACEDFRLVSELGDLSE